jgi:DNA-binding transcriptional MerR regulator
MTKALEAFRTISEVADELDVQKHVLRFWENKFPQVRPMKRGGGRRYYRPDDLDLLRGIRFLLHREGYTIKGVQKLLREQGLDYVKVCWQPGHATRTAAATDPDVVKAGRKGRIANVQPSSSVRPGASGFPSGGSTAHLAELEACRRILRGDDVAAAIGSVPSQRAAK